jgi:hypothetical protein
MVRDRAAMNCPACGQPRVGGTAIACLEGGRSVTVALPAHCVNPECQKKRDEAALQRAVDSGLIDP